MRDGKPRSRDNSTSAQRIDDAAPDGRPKRSLLAHVDPIPGNA